MVFLTAVQASNDRGLSVGSVVVSWEGRGDLSLFNRDLVNRTLQ